jgi:single-strand DNA-binding protein
MTASRGEPQGSRNEVVLCGRVAAAADERELPSGDVVMTTRIIVDRDSPTLSPAMSKSRQRVDTLDCVAWSSRTQRAIRNWRPGDVVHVEGAVRRRFYRGVAGTVSRVEVEVRTARRVRRAG